MPFPQTREALQQAGYRFDNHATCRGCKADIEWYFTPTGRKMPFNLMAEANSPAVAHFTDCPNAEDFRRSKVVR